MTADGIRRLASDCCDQPVVVASMGGNVNLGPTAGFGQLQRGIEPRDLGDLPSTLGSQP